MCDTKLQYQMNSDKYVKYWELPHKPNHLAILLSEWTLKIQKWIKHQTPSRLGLDCSQHWSHLDTTASSELKCSTLLHQPSYIALFGVAVILWNPAVSAHFRLSWPRWEHYVLHNCQQILQTVCKRVEYLWKRWLQHILQVCGHNMNY